MILVDVAPFDCAQGRLFGGGLLDPSVMPQDDVGGMTSFVQLVVFWSSF